MEEGINKTQEKDNYPNLNRDNKWLGIIDYKSLVILLVILFLTWNILGVFIQNQIYRTYLLVIIAIPFLGLFYANKSSENISNVIYIALKYIVSPKLYVYNIESNYQWLK